MDSIQIFAFLLIVIVICGILGFGAYLYYDFLEHRQTLETDLVQSSKDLNYNFLISSSNIDDIYKKVSTNQDKLYLTSNLLVSLDSYSSNTSNDLARYIVSTSNNTAVDYTNIFNNFDANLNRYFIFKEGQKNIAQKNDEQNSINTKIFNYIFTGDTPNIELIANTTAISGMTINSDGDHKFKICSTESPEKCVSMQTDESGKFIIKNNDDNTLLNIDTDTNTILFGADTESTANMYVKNNQVYLKTLNIMSADNNMSNIYTFDTEKYAPIYTKCTITNSPNATDNTKINNTISITMNFSKNKVSGTTHNISINIPYINLNAFQNSNKEYKTQSNSVNRVASEASRPNYINLIFSDILNQQSTNTDRLSGKVTFNKNTFTVTIEDQMMLQSHKLQIIVYTEGVDNFTTLPNNTTYTFVTNSYFVFAE